MSNAHRYEYCLEGNNRILFLNCFARDDRAAVDIAKDEAKKLGNEYHLIWVRVPFIKTIYNAPPRKR